MKKPPLLPVTGTTPFKDFIYAASLLLKQYPTLKFTDGWCFGDPADISLERGIDTLVGGGDSNYHHTEGMTPETLIKLTPSGFRVTDDWQFVWVLPTPAPERFETLGDVADYQRRFRFNMLADAPIEELGPDRSGFGDMPRYFKRVNKKIRMSLFCHAEDAQDEPDLLDPKMPVIIRKDGSLHIPNLPDTLGMSNGENLFTFMCSLNPIDVKRKTRGALKHKSKVFDPFDL